MFGLGLPEILFIVLLAALILGPEHMPRVARTLGKWSAKARSAATTLGQAVIQDEETRAAARDLSKLQEDIQNARNQVLSIRRNVSSGVSGIAKMALDGVAVEDRDGAKTKGEAINAETADSGKNGDCSPLSHAEGQGESQREESGFFSQSLAQLHERRDWQTSYGDLLATNRERSVSLAKPFLLPEVESRKVRRKRVPFPPATSMTGEFETRFSVGRSIASTPLPRAASESESDKARRRKIALPPAQGDDGRAHAVKLPDPRNDVVLYRVKFLGRPIHRMDSVDRQ